MGETELKDIEEQVEQRFRNDRMLCAEYRTINRLIAEIRRLSAENERLQVRWDYIKGRHIRCGSLHMDGIGSYSVVGAIGVGRTAEKAVDNAAVLHGYLAAAKPQE